MTPQDLAEARILAADAAAELAATVSHSMTRAMHPGRRMSDAERRENLIALAQAIVSEASWTVPHVLTPAAYRPLVTHYATAEDPLPAFGRLLLAVASCNQRDADVALDRLVCEAAA